MKIKILILSLLFASNLLSMDMNIDALDHNLLSTDIEVVKKTINAGANINAKDKHGYTALMWAVKLDCKETAKILIKSGADIDAQNNQGYTALILGVMHNRIEIVEMLIYLGADINIKDNENNTALMYAQENCNAEIIKIFQTNITELDINDTTDSNYYKDENNNEYSSYLSSNAPHEDVALNIEFTRTCQFCGESEDSQFCKHKVSKFNSPKFVMTHAKKILQKNNGKLYDTNFHLRMHKHNGTMHLLSANQRTGCMGLNKLCKVFKKLPK